MKVSVLGSGTPTPTSERFGSAFAVEIDDTTLMFDCGPAATHKLVKAGISPVDVDYLFFTHHHFDHNSDYACLVLCRWDQGADQIKPLRVLGPTHTSLITDRLIGNQGAFEFDWKARVGYPTSQRVFTNRGGNLPRKPPQVNCSDIEPGAIVEGTNFLVTASHAQHVQPYLDSLAYRVTTEYGTVVFTGDTEPCEDVERLASGADILFSMCWDTQERMSATGEDTGQMGTTAAMELSQRAGVKTLVLVHTGPHLSEPSTAIEAIEDMRGGFEGEIVFAYEGLSLQLGANTD